MFFIQVLIFNVNFSVQFWFQSLLGFVDILCFYFREKTKEELNGVTLSALLCLTFTRREKRNVGKKEREERGFPPHAVYPSSVSSPAHFKKRVFSERLHILVLLLLMLFLFFMFVCTFWLRNLLYFSTKKTGPNIFIVADLSMDTWLFQVSVCVWANAMVLLRFLLNTATSSRFPTGNKLFLKKKYVRCLRVHFISQALFMDRRKVKCIVCPEHPSVIYVHSHGMWEEAGGRGGGHDPGRSERFCNFANFLTGFSFSQLWSGSSWYSHKHIYRSIIRCFIDYMRKWMADWLEQCSSKLHVKFSFNILLT